MASGTELRILALYDGREAFLRHIEKRLRQAEESMMRYGCGLVGDGSRMYTERLTGDAIDGHKANIEKVKVDLDYLKEYLPERLRSEAQKVKDTLGDWQDKLDKSVGTKDR